MAVTVTETTYTPVKEIKFAWTSNGDGDASGSSTKYYTGEIVRITTVPGADASAPTADYDIQLLDDNSVDVAIGYLADRSATETESVNNERMWIANSKITIFVSNAGDTKSGTCYCYISGSHQPH